MSGRRRPIRAWRSPQAPSTPSGQAAVVEHAIDHELVRMLGGVPLLMPIIEKLDLRDVVNRRLYPSISGYEDLDWGLSTVVLVLNRLLAPKPLVHVESWLETTAIPDLLGFEAKKANDDRLGRTLDCLSSSYEDIWIDLIANAVSAFDLDLSTLGYDITSLSFCGAYEKSELIRYGYSRDHRPDRKQVELATTFLLEGGVPFDYRVLAGKVADSTTPVENLRRLQRLLSRLPKRDGRRPVVVSDRAMLTEKALVAYEDSGLSYVGPLDPSVGQGAVRQLLRSVPAEELAEAVLAYRPQRIRGQTPSPDDPTWEPYHGVERVLSIPRPEADPLEIRAVVVWSAAKARIDRELREKHIEGLEKSFAELAGKIGRRPYTTRNTVDKRVQKLLSRNPGRPFVKVEVTEEDGEIRLCWSRDDEAITAATQWDGRYVLGTNDWALTVNEILTFSKRRDVPEKGFRHLKGTLEVRPIYLHIEKRVVALVFCTMVALLIFSILELLARRAAVGRSAKKLLEHFSTLTMLVVVMKDATRLVRVIAQPDHFTVLDALGWPPPDHYFPPHP